jgi:hypothetical protein
MGIRRLTSAAAACAVTIALFAGVAGCGDEESPAFSEEANKAYDAQAAARKAEIEQMVRDGDLPPVAKNLIRSDGTIHVNFIDGPNNGDDIVRSGPDGTTGKKLQWDLDRNGRIDKSERTITEFELYEATAGTN